MTDQTFRQTYAGLYDLLYGEKDYGAECDLLERVFRDYSEIPVETVLDLGCGTGNHTIPLAQRGYRMTGADLSPEMLAHARAKASQTQGIRSMPVFHHQDLRTLDLGEPFDAVIMMFAVLGYQLTNADVSAAMRTVRRHLKPGGVFFCDFWYGPAVLTVRPGEQVKVLDTGEGRVIRAAMPVLDISAQVCRIDYHLWQLDHQRVQSETTETHRMRFFFPQELNLFLEHAGLTLRHLAAFPDLACPASETTWNVMAIAR